MTDMLSWVRSHDALLQGLGLLSVLMFVGSLAVFPVIVAQLPRDYFVRPQRNLARQRRRFPLVWAALTVLKNLLGLVLILAGVAMLVLPGQGFLTILIGLALTNFPGKYALERRMVRRPSVARGLNRIRALAGKSDLDLPGDDGVAPPSPRRNPETEGPRNR